MAGGGNVVETLISAMVLDATAYEAGSKRVIAADNAMIASFKKVVAAHNAMTAAMGVSPPSGGSFGGNTLNTNIGSNNLPPNFSNLGGGAFSNNGSALGIGGGSGGFGGFGGFGGAFILLSVLRDISHVLEELGRKFVEFSGSALKEFASFDTLQKSFEGIYGSSEKAAQMMLYLRDAAMTSAFHFKDLADAARSISVAGLDVNRWLPITQGFALAMGHIDAGGLQDFVSILRRLQGGNTGLALGPRGIGRYGVSRAELETHGAKFDSKGHFLGSINEAFDAVEAVFKARIEAIASNVKASSEVVLSNWTDAIQQATIDAGAGIAQNLIEPIKQLTGVMNTLRQAGVFKDLFDDLYGIIDIQGLLGSPEKIRYDFTKDPRTGKTLSSAEQRRARDDYEKTHFGERGGKGLGSRVPTTTGDPMQDLLINIGGYLVSIVEFTKLSFLELVRLYEFFQPWRAWGGGVNPSSLVGYAEKAGQDFRDQAYERVENDWKDRVLHPDKFKAPVAPTGNEIEGLDDDMEEANTHLRHIRNASDRIANHFDARTTAFGANGPYGSVGVTRVEMGNYYQNLGSGISHKFAIFGVSLEQEFQAMISRAFGQGVRQGYVMGSARGG